jgi:hypothetical protein
MAVVVVDKGPDPSVVKKVICQKCGATLEYTPLDVRHSSSTDMDGGYDTRSYIKCPQCKEIIDVKDC